MARTLVMVLVDDPDETPEQVKDRFKQYLHDEYGNGDGIAVLRSDGDLTEDADEFEIADWMDVMADDLESMMEEINKRRAEEEN